jgi:hypothetical protein
MYHRLLLLLKKIIINVFAEKLLIREPVLNNKSVAYIFNGAIIIFRHL